MIELFCLLDRFLTINRQQYSWKRERTAKLTMEFLANNIVSFYKKLHALPRIAVPYFLISYLVEISRKILLKTLSLTVKKKISN